MTLTLLPEKRRWNRRIQQLPAVKHNCLTYGIWTRSNGGQLVCRICGAPAVKS